MNDGDHQQCPICGLARLIPEAPTAAELQQLLSAATLNTGCFCPQLPPSREALSDEIAVPQYAAAPLFVAQRDIDVMATVIRAIDKLAHSSAWRARVLPQAPAIAQRDPGYPAVQFGFDFHLTESGPQLIEINTNAGGALLNAILARSQRACCREMVSEFEPTADLNNLEQTFFAMFVEEWRRQRGDARLGRAAIVDDDPAGQYLFPEMRLFERMFARFGAEAVIADPRELIWREGRLWHGARPVELVYNRLTDFYLEEPAHAALRAAYEAGAVVLTPHPRAHALYADKRNLVTLSNENALVELGIPAETRALLVAGIPHTEAVTPQRAEALWSERRKLFFKPAAGYGSKAAYRGDKLTRRVWGEILRGDYVAQALVAPSERRLKVASAETDLKLDVRAYVYGGAIQLVAARLYEGQTTNFRTPGGGFAPVFVVGAENKKFFDPDQISA